MSTVNLPINFGHRQCDRKLVRRLTMDVPSLTRQGALWMMFLVWQDFATAREDRRLVPVDPADRVKATATLILEEYIGWQEVPGTFVESAIEEGFFLLIATTDGIGELVLVDFFPANANTATLSNSARGGLNKVFNRVKVQAEAAASDQLQLFQRTAPVEVEGVTPAEIKSVSRLIHSICLALRWKTPEQEDWRNHLIAKGADVVRATTQEERDFVVRWLISARNQPQIPSRIDFLLDAFTTFIPDAKKAFGIH